MIMRIEQNMKNNNVSSPSYERELLQKFDLSLLENLKKCRYVKYYADELTISTKKLNSLTKTYYGITAKEYIEEKIIIDSKKLLKESPETVKQISYNLGFTEPTNFNKFFKKLTSITPLQYREHHLKSLDC